MGLGRGSAGWVWPKVSQGAVVRWWLSGLILKVPSLPVLGGLREPGLLGPLCLCGLSQVAAWGQPDSSGALSGVRGQTTSLLRFVHWARPCLGSGDIFFLSRKCSGFCLHLQWFEISTTIFAVCDPWWGWRWLHSLGTLNLTIPNFFNLPLEMSFCGFFGVSIQFLDLLLDSWQT